MCYLQSFLFFENTTAGYHRLVALSLYVLFLTKNSFINSSHVTKQGQDTGHN